MTIDSHTMDHRSAGVLLIATGNEHKKSEFERLLPHISLRTLKDHPLSEPLIEDADDFEGNALIKSRAGARHTGMLCLADDSGICVDALNGAPGVYSARYVSGTDRDRLFALLSTLEGESKRGAHFYCALSLSGLTSQQKRQLGDLSEFEGLSWRDGDVVTSGICRGSIHHEPLGEEGFGYDPIFLLPSGRCVAQLSNLDKDMLSHRGRATEKIYPLLKNIFDMD